MAEFIDVYEIDTSGAVTGMTQLEKVTGNVKQKTDEFNTSLKAIADEFKGNFAKQIASAQAQYELLKKVVQETIQFVKEGIHEWEEDAKAKARQAVLLRNLGDGAEMYRAQLEAQQKQIERNMGLDEAYVANLQNVVMGMGVAAGETVRYTEAAVKLANLMGTDAVNAARLMARANAEGKEELKRFGIVAKDGVDLLTQIEERTKGINNAMPEYTKLVNQQSAAWGDFKKGVGEWVANFWVFLNRDVVKANEALENMRKTMSDARWMELKGIFSQHGMDIERMRAGMMQSPEGPEFDREKLDKDNAASAEARRKAAAQKAKEEHDFFLELAKGKFELDKEMREAAQKEALASRERFYKQMQNEAEDDKDIEVATLDAMLEEEKQIHQFSIEAAKKKAEEEKRLAKEAADIQKQHLQDVLNEFKQFGQQLIGFGLSMWRESLTAQTKFNEQMKQYQIDREVMASKELGLNKSRADIEKQLTAEAANAQKQRTADFLAGIAQQAVMTAIMESAKAIASLASYDYGGAALHAAAAVAFGAIAATTGAAASSISTGRGMTTGERQQLEQAELDKRERMNREKEQAGQVSSGTERGSNINIFYLGLPGMTEAEMGKDLARIQSTYDDLKTGGG